jgi:hypothetical protein
MSQLGQLHALPHCNIAVCFTPVSGIDSRSQALPSRAKAQSTKADITPAFSARVAPHKVNHFGRIRRLIVSAPCHVLVGTHQNELARIEGLRFRRGRLEFHQANVADIFI